MKQELKLPVQKEDFLFFTIPETISVGLSPTLDINCSASHSDALNMSILGSLSILRIHEEVEQLMVDLKTGHDISVKPGADSDFVEGSLDSNEGFIALGWSIPGVDQAGVYICEISGIDADGLPIFLSRRKNVTWEEPNPQELVDRLAEIYHAKADLENRLNQTKTDLENRLNQTKTDLENRLGKAERLARDATEKLALLRNNSVCAKSCSDLTLPVGQHEVILAPDNLGPLKVLCDVKIPSETWTIFQKRFDGSVDFYRNFSEYENGFGSIIGEHWLGLKHIKRLLDASGNNHELRVDMVLASKRTRYTRIYPTFSIGPGDSYTLTVAGYGDGGYGMSRNNGGAFSTYDHGPKQGVATTCKSGWWFNPSTSVNLNGVWGTSGSWSSILWWEISQNTSVTFSATEMKFRSRN